MPHKKEILARALGLTGIGRMLRAAGGWRGLLVLNYHRIGDAHGTSFDTGVFSATVEQFQRQLDWLAQHATVIGLADLDRALAARRGRFVLLTFDDGYRDNFERAFPALRASGLPATFFITTGFIDDHRIAWWDEISWMVNHAVHRLPPCRVGESLAGSAGGTEESRPQTVRRLLQAYKSLPTDAALRFLDEIAETTGAGRCPLSDDASPWMTWDMVRSLRAAGHAIGAHTVTHPLLAQCSIEQQREELAASKSRLEAMIGGEVEALSYPVGIPGSFSDDTVQLAHEAGYRWAFSFSGGYCPPGEGSRRQYRLPRVAMESGLSHARFEALCTLPGLFA